MTKQQIQDYAKVESLSVLRLWVECDERYKGMSFEELPLRCAISDMEMIVDNADAENYGDSTANVVRKAKWFLRKYAKQGVKQ